MSLRWLAPTALIALGLLGGCQCDEPSTPVEPAREVRATLPDTLPRGLLVASSRHGARGEPAGARLSRITRRDGSWHTETVDDPGSNVLHLARAIDPAGDGSPGILTLGGTAASVKIWRPDRSGTLVAEEIWHAQFGERSSRMRDAEVAPLWGAAPAPGGIVGDVIVVGTHDEGVVAALSPSTATGWTVTILDRQPATILHEIEVGDLDGDGVLEVYATPSSPNALMPGAEQHGQIVRYVPAAGIGRTVVADLTPRHAKEILVADVDGDGRDELYAAVEALTRGVGDATEIVAPVEIRRFDGGTPGPGVVIATIPDRQTRFLTAGDLDGDGHRELVAAAMTSGLWRLTPGSDPRGEWSIESLDGDSGGFEHAALLTDLDGDAVDELYVASDDAGELRRYVWRDGRAVREVIASVPPGSTITWSIAPYPVER